MDLSFTRAQAIKALKETGNNVERAGSNTFESIYFTTIK
jgi:hypothetical protein